MSELNFMGMKFEPLLINEEDPTPYEHLIRFKSDEGIWMALGYRNGTIEIIEWAETKNPAAA